MGQILDTGTHYILNGAFYIKGESRALKLEAEAAQGLHTIVVRPIETTAEVKAAAKVAVKMAAERERQKHITPGDGKASEYMVKANESARILADTASALATPADFPYAHERATRRGETVVQVAQDWKAQIDAWTTTGVQISGAVETAVDAIDAMPDDLTVSNHDAIRAIVFVMP